MKISNRDVDDVLAKVRQQLQDDQTLSVSLFNFNQDAFDRAAGFEHWFKDRLAESELMRLGSL